MKDPEEAPVPVTHTSDLQFPRSRVLMLTQDMVWPAVGGGRIRCIKLLRAALEHVWVDLIMVAPEPDVLRDQGAIEELPRLTTHFFSDESNSPIVPARVSPAAQNLIRKRVEAHGGYDVVHLEGHFLWPIVPPELHSRTVVVEYNIESQLVQQRLFLGDPVTTEEVARLRASEDNVWQRATELITLSPEDTDALRARVPVVPHLIPNGWDDLPAPAEVAGIEAGPLTEPTLLFYADYDYMANRDALHWLIEQVFPEVRRQVPGAKLVVGGINFSPDIREMVSTCPGAHARGFIDDLADELDRADIVLCPLRWGGGVKVKVTEAIRRARPLVTTSIGAQGIPPALRPGVCVADDAAGLAEHVVRLCHDGDERQWRRAHLLANRQAGPTWHDATSSTIRVWSDVARRADAAAGERHSLEGKVDHDTP
jgi:polysaccharide biosynthesis protein PslH